MMNENNYKKYEGDVLDKYRPEFGLDAYIPAPELVQAVEAARLLGRPLLLRGEPGCGKTRLAEAIAVELHGEAYRDFYFPWPIKSTTKAQDGLYRFDHLERMQDVYAAKEQPDDPTAEAGLMQYVKLGPIGKAYERMNKFPEAPPPVILIDEIDKADIDFPNDLLWELDKREFFITEVKDQAGNDTRIGIEDKNRAPVVIITSNDEKELPNAFLRRCLFHFIEFPGEEQLKGIVKKYLEGLTQRETDKGVSSISIGSGKVVDSLEAVLEHFKGIRGTLRDNLNASKAPSTSELLDWARILAIYLGRADWSVDEQMNLVQNGEIRLRPEQILLKNRDDERLVKNT
ncbi:MAG: MoxR family ATPase [Phaeodactylibacter sp.]|nr:MoxR family ATPase [Phaeodactylibacter sp.]